MFLKKEKGYIQKQLIPNSIDSFHARSHHDCRFCTNSMYTNGGEGGGGGKAKPFSRNTNAIEASVTLAQNKVCSRTFFLSCVEFLVSSAGEPSPPLELLLPPEKGRVGLGRAACRFCRALIKTAKISSGQIACVVKRTFRSFIFSF